MRRRIAQNVRAEAPNKPSPIGEPEEGSLVFDRRYFASCSTSMIVHAVGMIVLALMVFSPEMATSIGELVVEYEPEKEPDETIDDKPFELEPVKIEPTDEFEEVPELVTIHKESDPAPSASPDTHLASAASIELSTLGSPTLENLGDGRIGRDNLIGTGGNGTGGYNRPIGGKG